MKPAMYFWYGKYVFPLKTHCRYLALKKQFLQVEPQTTWWRQEKPFSWCGPGKESTSRWSDSFTFTPKASSKSRNRAQLDAASPRQTRIGSLSDLATQSSGVIAGFAPSSRNTENIFNSTLGFSYMKIDFTTKTVPTIIKVTLMLPM